MTKTALKPSVSVTVSISNSSSFLCQRVPVWPGAGHSPYRIDKMVTEALRDAVITITALVPARTGTAWWHRALAGGAQVEFLRGRVKCWKDGKEGNAAPFDSALLLWRS